MEICENLLTRISLNGEREICWESEEDDYDVKVLKPLFINLVSGRFLEQKVVEEHRTLIDLV